MKAKWLKLISCAVICCTMLVSFGTCEAADTKLPILMYHDLTEDPAKTNSMTITGERFRMDMEYLQQFGYTALLPSDLIDIKNGVREMPEKPIMITFDDGYRSNYTIAYPVLQQTGMKAAIAVIAYNMQTENAALADRHALTWEEIYEMAQSGIVEIGSHTYNLHNPQYKGNSSPNGIDGVQRLSGESQSGYHARVGADLNMAIAMITQHTGQQKVNYFSYPFGAYDSYMQQLLDEMGVSVSTLTNPGVANIATGLHRLPRYRITMEQPVSALLRQSEIAVPALSKVSVNGVPASLPAYMIGGSNYVRVRDVAALLAGSAAGFDVQWNAAAGRVELTSFTAYTPLGSENAVLPAESKTVSSVTEPTVVDGISYMTAAFNIGGNSFYKLRSLGDLCGFLVDWDAETQTVNITS
ncbi:polysaccharide deacetylase family protein [Butyricicoccus faecihominis]|uniref:polysaccharide deacetylase family protein n=1 Tax=Butyricicoccus faecihominis TaxID=1712515 RepID=UPI00247877B2|nr:polysaccharide deacetylase family protein [Butyricicoccus faecihominis]MCQ5128741.1 polysaccharide deacetylase family protein [Butyricicoccus faecihominis]